MENLFYYAFDEKIFLDKVENKIVLSFEEKYLSEIQDNFQKNINIQHIELQTYNSHCIFTTTKKADIKTIIDDLKKLAGVKSINPMYTVSGLEMAVTDEFVVQFKENASKLAIDEMRNKYQVEIRKITELFIIYSVPVNFNVLEVANAYQESGLTNFSNPSFISQLTLSLIPDDQYFNNQYYLRNTGQTVNGRTCTSGSDIRVESAWGISKGSSDIVIAVLDEGITSNHPDLPNTRQVRLNGSNFGDGNQNDPSPTGNMNHGNSCAGIIAASHNSEGIAGIAPNCKIMPVRIFNSNGTSVSPTDVASAISFAKNNGADIISNSWGYSSQNGQPLSPNLHPQIVTAISDATNNGRGGKGCLVVFAAGNTANQISDINGYITFPANVTNERVITVGASDRNDRQANYSPTSILNNPNNQLLDVMAPSHRAFSSQIAGETYDIWTIDIPGNTGYNPVKTTDGGNLPIPNTILPDSGTNFEAYTGHFGGTSAACPQVSGVAALMLSKNPTLTNNDVASLIRTTARKANSGIYDYQTTKGRPNGSWNSRMGYGVVNAYSALINIPPPPPPFYIATTPGNYSGTSTIYTDSSGYAGISLLAFATQSQPNNYVWSAQFYGECNRWFLWPSHSRADISVYLDFAQSGGTLRIECNMYIGNTFLGTTFYYLEVRP